MQMEIPELLMTAAVRNHLALFLHILHRMLPSPSTDLTLVLREACYSGSLEITNMIIQASPPEILGRLCAVTLSRHRGSRRVSPVYHAAAEQVLKGCGEISRLDLCMMLWSHAKIRASPVVRLILEKYRGRIFYPLTPNMLVASFSALWYACVNDDIDCVRVLIRHGDFASIPSADIRELCLDGMDAAVHANAFPICQELCKFLDIETHTLCFKDLAGVDGSLSAMIQKLEINPDELGAKAFMSDKHTVGQLALSRAVTLLRVENVRFLLENGVRLNGTCFFEPLMIQWRRKKAYEHAFGQVQGLLQQHGLAQLQVEL